MDIKLNNLEVRIKDGYCNLVDLEKGNLFWIRTLIPEENAQQLNCLLKKKLSVKQFFNELQLLVTKPVLNKYEFQNYTEKKYPVGIDMHRILCD